MGIDLSVGFRQKAIYHRNLERPVKTESRLVLVGPWREAPDHEPRVKFTTERPYFPKNRRLKRFETF